MLSESGTGLGVFLSSEAEKLAAVGWGEGNHSRVALMGDWDIYLTPWHHIAHEASCFYGIFGRQ